jgi:hypothetical protein
MNAIFLSRVHNRFGRKVKEFSCGFRLKCRWEKLGEWQVIEVNKKEEGIYDIFDMRPAKWGGGI